MKAPKIISILEKLMGGTVVGLMSQLLFKEAGSPYASQAWNPHQDNSYPKTPNGEYVTINLALQDQDIENGCLYIYPGSHKEGLFDFEPTKSYRENPDDNPGNMVERTILNRFENVKTDLIIKKGGVLFMQGNCIHGSYANVSDRSRPLLSMSYIPKGTYLAWRIKQTLIFCLTVPSKDVLFPVSLTISACTMQNVFAVHRRCWQCTMSISYETF